jgi:aminoglycoside phosphotransferase (APT) family kinase protein
MTTAARTRIGWRELPAPVQSRIEQIIGGGRVVEARSQPGGFSPGTADRVRTTSGRRAFVKAVSSAINERSAVLARQEMRVTAALPAHAPVPRMLGGFESDDWVVLVLQDVEGVHPRTPWVSSEIDAAVAALGELAAALTPAPVVTVPHASENLGGDLAGWSRVAADPPADLDPWLAERLPELCAAADRAHAALATGDTLVHADIRADNMLITPDGRVVIVDWPWGCIGPAWFDSVLLALNVVVHGGDPERVIAGLDPRIVADLFAGLAGFFWHAHRLPPPPGIPAVRAFQRWQADALLPWLRTHPPGGMH